MGWPTSEGLPARMRLMGFVPNEPDCLYVLGESEDKQSGIWRYYDEQGKVVQEIDYSKLAK
jgi:hypothetical protein